MVGRTELWRMTMTERGLKGKFTIIESSVFVVPFFLARDDTWMMFDHQTDYS